MRATPDLDLLLVHADDHTPVLERGVGWPDTVDAPAPAPRPQPSLLWSESADASDLAAQRWGVIAPQGKDGDRLLDLVAPLIARRQSQQGRPVRIYRVPARMSMEEAIRWKRRGFRRGDDLDLDLPRYQLVLGDLDQVPASVQQALGTDGFVGRLAFEHADEYRAYVDKVQRWEARPAAAARGDAILHTVHDGTPATRRGSDALMEPGRRILERRRDFGDVRVAEIRATGTSAPAPAELWRAVGAWPDAGEPGPPCSRPGVLVTLGHGLGAPRAGWSAARQRAEQGALSFGGGGALSGRDLAGRAFLPGGAWLALACFSAGTPDRSDYHHWLAMLGQAGHVRGGIGHVLDTLTQERPFVAALPKAALASPEGPLAFIGHVDLAWAYSFLDLDDRPTRRPGRLMGVVQSLLHGDRAGVALRQLARFFDEVNTELTALYAGHARAGRPTLDPRARARRGHLWMLRQDLAGWMLLGDPAVRLPLAAAGDPTGAVRAPGGAMSPGADVPPDVPDTRDAIDALEAAVLAVLGGDALADVSRAHGLEAAALARMVAGYRDAGRAAIARAQAAQAPSTPDADGP
jgi:hypothetical protein